MADTLYPESAQLLGGASRSAGDNADRSQKDSQFAASAGEANSAGLPDLKDISGQQAAQKLEQLKRLGVQITPQMALGLFNINKDDPNFMTLSGSHMDPHMLLGWTALEYKKQFEKMKSKVVQVYGKDGKIQHAVLVPDENGGPPTQYILDEGMNASHLHPKGSGKGSGGPKDETFKKNQQFIKSYEKARGEIADPARAAQLKATNPDSYTEKTQWLKDNQDQYDTLVKEMGQAGATGAPGGTPGDTPSGTPDNAPFDADAFIKDALGQ